MRTVTFCSTNTSKGLYKIELKQAKNRNNLLSGSNDSNTRAPLVSSGQWLETCIVDHENRYDNYFIGVYNEGRAGLIKCYDSAWEKITDLKLSQPLYGICIIPGDSFSKLPKLACITKFDVRSQFKYQLRTWTIMEKGSVKNKVWDFRFMSYVTSDFELPVTGSNK